MSNLSIGETDFGDYTLVKRDPSGRVEFYCNDKSRGTVTYCVCLYEHSGVDEGWLLLKRTWGKGARGRAEEIFNAVVALLK